MKVGDLVKYRGGLRIIVRVHGTLFSLDGHPEHQVVTKDSLEVISEL